ncbi:hypothetical protein AB0H51_11495 [Streptomyces griseoluteus]|uniref:hypothetical protein n=1 Tax=Streptomyces griseoluteus TaxID=29306 RepID=UPI0033F471A3
MPTPQSVDALLDAYAAQAVALKRVRALVDPILDNGPNVDPAERRMWGLAHRISVAIKPTTAERPCTFREDHPAHTYPYGPGESARYCPGLRSA